MDSPVRFTRPLLALMIGVPLAWAVLLWFHPDVDPNHVYADLREDVVANQIVHVGTLVFIGLMGLALYLLVRDLPLSFMVVSHPPPIGPIGLLCFAGAVALLARAQRVSSRLDTGAPAPLPT